jgi:hypothetical protein
MKLIQMEMPIMSSANVEFYCDHFGR